MYMRRHGAGAVSLLVALPLLLLMRTSHAERQQVAPIGRLPVMGYSNWYDTKCDVHASRFLEAAEALEAQGLKALGYTQINI